MRIDRITRNWIANEADEHAASLGMRVDERRIDHVIESLNRHIVMWEGEAAGKHWAPLEWQYEVFGAVFGWVRWDDHFKRYVRRHRVASVWIGKKNGKSPTGALVGLYLTRFDGETGNQVYSAARDGRQAEVVHNNAIQMVKASPTLSEELKIHKTTKRIIWEKGASVYAPMSSDNVLSQEGLNGSAIVDEVHTVDDRLARVIADMGASRAEPLRFEISTAGEDMEKYGRKQWEYGSDVANGLIRDPAFYFRAWAVPPDVPEADLCSFRGGQPTKKTLDYWRMANPALDEILPRQEMIDSCNRSRRSQSDWRAWMQRRLNRWQNTAAPWLDPAEWDAAAVTLEWDSIAGLGGGMGLDLARVNDITAAVAVFPHPSGADRLCCWPRFWASEDRVEKLATRYLPQILDWVDDGLIIATPGNVTDYGLVEDGLAEMIEHIGTETVCYDPQLATELVARLRDRLTDPLFVEFKQSMTAYAAPTADFERGIIAGEIGHNGNPVLSWQARNAMVYRKNQLAMPIRPKNQAYKTIDGVVAAVMGLFAQQIGGGVGYDAQLI